jgi:nitrogen fixation protein NifB
MEQTIENKSGQDFRAAVASYEGLLVNQHLGMSESLLVYEVTAEGHRFIERRRTPRPGSGNDRWQALAGLLADCKYLLTNSAGRPPVEALSAKGIQVLEIEGLIENALADLHRGVELRMPGHRLRCKRAESGAAGFGCG